MSTRFNTILIPVDFSMNTEIAVKKALALCEGSNVSIHLLHVSHVPGATVINPYQFFARYSSGQRRVIYDELERKMWELQSYIKSKNKDAEISTWISYDSSVEKVIVKKAKRVSADLIVIGKNTHHSWFPFLNTVNPTRIARNSGISVLSAGARSLAEQIRTVVIPVGENFPDHTVTIIHALQKKFRIRVRLVAFSESSSDSDFLPSSLLNAYRVFKSNPAVSVSCELLRGGDQSKAILGYCKRVNADLLIVGPGPEAKVLSIASGTQVLAIQSL